MQLANIAAALTAFAQGVVADAVAEGQTFLQQSVEPAAEFVEAEAKLGYTDFMDLVSKVGKRATELVTDLMNDATLLGTEKANLVATTLVEEASAQGITMLAQDVTTLVKNAYIAVTDAVAAL